MLPGQGIILIPVIQINSAIFGKSVKGSQKFSGLFVLIHALTST